MAVANMSPENAGPTGMREKTWGSCSVNNRRENRTLCQGEVRLFLETGSEAAIQGELVDVSSSGFCASYHEISLSAGTEVRFRHKFFHGRARVMWSSTVLRSTRSGFQVLRD